MFFGDIENDEFFSQQLPGNECFVTELSNAVLPSENKCLIQRLEVSNLRLGIQGYNTGPFLGITI